jgi:uncharacterized caspase-like protein
MQFWILLILSFLLLLASWDRWRRSRQSEQGWRIKTGLAAVSVATGAFLYLVAFLTRPLWHARSEGTSIAFRSVIRLAQVGTWVTIIGLVSAAFARGKTQVFVFASMLLLLLFWFLWFRAVVAV